jgi:hypothetical protein
MALRAAQSGAYVSETYRGVLRAASLASFVQHLGFVSFERIIV